MAQRKRSHLWRTQNFLRHSADAERLIERAGLTLDDLVVEIGAGAGNLTELLAVRCRRVVAIEKDEALCRALRHRLSSRTNVVIRCGNFRQFRLPRTPYKVFSNPPFDVTAEIVTTLTRATLPPKDAFLVMQKEAADRFMGRPKETLAALLLKPWFAPAVFHGFIPHDFAPAPGVDVVMFRLRKRGPPLIEEDLGRLYRDFVTACFTAWQPTVDRALARVLGQVATRALLAHVDIHLGVRPSELALAGWLSLFRAFAQLPASLTSRVAGANAHQRRQQRRLRKCHRTRRSA
ncbi:MAG: rRNA adenine N(6)-methyltransferase family protein [Chloroflexota bacterium]|nr:rRNA adenine N(6)-methyltransferase family protein [Chloroflexota bacterium]